MQRVAKGFLLGLGGVVALGAVGVLAMNLYVQSAGTQARIERDLSNALGLPVKMTSTTVAPWGRLKVSGITVPQPDGGRGHFLEAESFSADFRWIPLFQHRLVVDEIAIDSPTVVWVQNEAGKWRLPHETEPATPASTPSPGIAAASPSPGEVPLEPPLPVPAEPKEPRKTTAPSSAPPFDVFVHRLRIKRGSFDFLDRKGRRVVGFAGVELECPEVDADKTSGKALIGRVSVHDVVFLENVRTPFSFAAGDLSLRDLEAEAGGGTLRGGLELRTAEKNSPMTISTVFEGIDLSRLITDAGGMPGQAAGTVNGWIDLYGKAGKSEGMSGKGQLRVTGGQIRQYEFLQLLGQALQIDELGHLTLREAQADYRVVNGTVWVDRLFLESPNLQLQAHGTVKPDGKLKLNARLFINRRFSERLPSFILTSFQGGTDADPLRYIDFPISGTITKPQTNLMERILGRKIEREMTDIFQSIIGGTKKKAKDKEKKPKTDSRKMSGPAATPAPSIAE